VPDSFIKIPDIIIALLALALIGFSVSAAYLRPQSSSQVLIQGPGQKWIFPLGAEETVSVKGPLGDTVVQIQGNHASVVSSPCHNQTCVASGRVNSIGRWVACLPNNVFLMIEGNDESADYPDSIAW
jgi:hypothetical protein